LEALSIPWGLGDVVHEHPQRVPYSRSLELLAESDGVFVLGVDEVGYLPSKLFSYALSGKPLLASLQRKSEACHYFESIPELGCFLSFDEKGEMPECEAEKVVERFLQELRDGIRRNRESMIREYLAPGMAARHAALFEACLAGG
jgi:hypothetical protein